MSNSADVQLPRSLSPDARRAGLRIPRVRFAILRAERERFLHPERGRMPQLDNEKP